MIPKALQGRTALVTGASRNIGRAIAHALADEGANVIVNGVTDMDAAKSVAAEVEAKGVGALPVLADVTDAEAVKAMAAQAVEAFGGLEILVINASTRGQKPFLEMAHQEFRKVLDVTLDGAFHLCQACIPHMQKAGWGRVVTLGGISWSIGTKNRVHNLAGKAGLTGFTRGIAKEFAADGITANCVSPGMIDTVRPASAGVSPHRGTSIPIDRLGKPEEIAAQVAFLCRPEAAYTTGQTINVNGGLYLS